MTDDPTRPRFWDQRYRAGRTPWDQGGVPAALADYLKASTEPGRVLIPGCGTGHELRAFAAAGWEVTAVDFSAPAVERARALVGPGLAERVVLADFFTLPLAAASCDAVYERTFLCALPPARWPDVVQRVAHALKPGGRWFGYFYFGDKGDGPPYGMSSGEASALFDADFMVVKDEPSVDALPLFAGGERWQERLRR